MSSVEHETSGHRGWTCVLLLGFALLGFSLWNFYIEGLAFRPFDVAVLGVLISAAMVGAGVHCFAIDSQGGRQVTYACIAVVVYGIIGVVADPDNVRPLLGLAMGVITFALGIALVVSDRRTLAKVTKFCIAIHCAAFWLQLAMYKATGILVNYQGWLGLQPRVFSSTFRASGLYMEPAQFSLAMFLFVALRLKAVRRIDWISAIAIISSVASMSLWGIGASLFLIIVTSWRTRPFWIFALFTAFTMVSGAWLLHGGKSFYLVARVLSLASDPTTSVRYGVAVRTVYNGFWDPTLWFGAGVTNDFLEFGASGVGFLTRAAGISGTLVFLMLIFVSSPRGEKLRTVAAVGLVLTAATFWTDMMWWFWLALMIRRIPAEDYLGGLAIVMQPSAPSAALRPVGRRLGSVSHGT